MPKQIKPVTFDAWLGKVIDDEARPHGGREAIASWIDVSEQSVNRRCQGKVPFLAREVELIAAHVHTDAAELVERALKKYGGIEKLIAEYAVSEPVPTVDDLQRKRSEKNASENMGEQIDRLEPMAANHDPEHEHDQPLEP